MENQIVNRPWSYKNNSQQSPPFFRSGSTAPSFVILVNVFTFLSFCFLMYIKMHSLHTNLHFWVSFLGIYIKKFSFPSELKMLNGMLDSGDALEILIHVGHHFLLAAWLSLPSPPSHASQLLL